LKLTSRSEYALLALVYLGRHKTDGLVPVSAIAQAQQIPPKFLEQILLALKRAKFVRSSKGQRGGYQLAKPAGKITLAQIVRLFDGALAPTESVSEHFYESTPIEKEGNLLRVFRSIRDHVAEELEATTIGDMI
jgi:Rrf2 family protein